jgi:hypothetical protein
MYNANKLEKNISVNDPFNSRSLASAGGSEETHENLN